MAKTSFIPEIEKEIEKAVSILNELLRNTTATIIDILLHRDEPKKQTTEQVEQA